MTSESARGDSWVDQLGAALESTEAEISVAFADVTVTVASDQWLSLLKELRDRVGLTYFDWLSAVDESDGRFTLFCHLYDPREHRRVLARTEISGVRPTIASATALFRGAAWHERETAEMFGIDFSGHPHLTRLLLSDDFEGHPLRKDFVLTARVSKSWPGAKEPGESGDGSPSRRKMQPPGVPDPTWGPRGAGDTDA